MPRADIWASHPNRGLPRLRHRCSISICGCDARSGAPHRIRDIFESIAVAAHNLYGDSGEAVLDFQGRARLVPGLFGFVALSAGATHKVAPENKRSSLLRGDGTTFPNQP